MTIPSVIFVDDDPDIRPVMEQTLTLEDIPVACFADGASALKLVQGSGAPNAYHFGAPLSMRPFPLPSGAKLSALPALGMVRYRAAPPPSGAACLDLLCAGSGRPADCAATLAASLTADLKEAQVSGNTATSK